MFLQILTFLAKMTYFDFTRFFFDKLGIMLRPGKYKIVPQSTIEALIEKWQTFRDLSNYNYNNTY